MPQTVDLLHFISALITWIIDPLVDNLVIKYEKQPGICTLQIWLNKQNSLILLIKALH
jgi:hypothetical protein